MGFAYLDSSAIVKLFKDEAESAALSLWLAGRSGSRTVTSDLSRTEVPRALSAAKTGRERIEEADRWLADNALVRLTSALCDRAGAIQPSTPLRSLDALHLASALTLGAALDVFVAYGTRLLAAAEAAGLKTACPGA